MKLGDVVSILPGAVVPFVLGQGNKEGSKKGKWRLVGEAYVHGIMHGEALEMEGWGLEEIVLE